MQRRLAPKRGHLWFHYVRPAENGDIKIVVGNTGERSAALEKLEFCAPCGAVLFSGSEKPEPPILSLRDAKTGRPDPEAEIALLYLISAGIEPPKWIGCYAPPRGTEPLRIVSSVRQVAPEASPIEVTVSAPEGYSLRDRTDDRAVVGGESCLLSLIPTEGADRAYLMLPCFKTETSGGAR